MNGAVSSSPDVSSLSLTTSNLSNSAGISGQISSAVPSSSGPSSTTFRVSNSSTQSMPVSASSSPIQLSVSRPIQTTPPKSRPDSLPDSPPSDSTPATLPVQVSSNTNVTPPKSRPDSHPTAPDSPPSGSTPATLPVQVSSNTNVTTEPSPPMVSSSPSHDSVSTPAADPPAVSPPPSPPVDTNPPSSAPPSSSVHQTSADVRTSAPVKPSSTAQTNGEVKSSGNQGSTAKAAPASPTNHASTPVPSAPVAHGPETSFTGTTTSTITDAPESTLAKPSFISVVDSNGKPSLSAPPLVTILSTSQEPNGSFVTFTHVVANPTGLNQAISSGRASFFHNAGAVAGVFLVIGVILTGVVASATFIMCRRRRRRREAHRRWLISVNRPRPTPDEPQEDPFEDPRSAPSPPMRVVPHAWNAPTAWDAQPRAANRDSSTSALGLFDVPPTQHNEVVEEQPRHNATNRNEIGLAITTNGSKHSLARSSPSIYPPSLPPANDDRGFEEPQRYRDNASPPPPPRPRRSHLRDAPSKGILTPPSSVSDHSPVSEVAAASPWGFTPTERETSPIQLHGSPQLNEIMGRKTLLDVRPRSQDSARTVR